MSVPSNIHGQRVARGQLIGRMSTNLGSCPGRVTGVHVHFTAYRNGSEISVNGMDIGGWTVEQTGGVYQGCMRRIRDGLRVCAEQNGSARIYNDGTIGSGGSPPPPPPPPPPTTTTSTPPPGSCSPNADQVALYDGTNFGGSKCVIKGIGSYPNPASFSPLPNDQAKSVRVGANVKTTICQNDDLNSFCEDLSADDPDLGNNSIGNNQVSSFKVESRIQCIPDLRAEASPSGLSGDDGWFRSNVSVSLAGRDANGCGQAVSLEYALDGGAWSAYGLAIAVSGDGTHHLRYRARSAAVTGAEQELELKIDTVPPTIAGPTISGPVDINGIVRDEAVISTPWQDAGSGVRWVRRRCGTDPFIQSAGGDASWTLAGVGVTACDSYARDTAGWEASVWNSGPLVFNRFSLDASGKLTIDFGTGIRIDGMTRASEVQVNYNTNTFVDSPIWLTAPGTVTSTGNTSTNFNTVAAPTPVPRLDYPFEFYRNRSIVVQGPLVIDNVEKPLPPACLYVIGDITIRAVKLNSKACLIATGNIIDQSTASTFVSGDPANGLLMMAGGSVTIGSTGNQNTGLVFAPNGTITVNGATGLDSRGSLVGKDITLTGVTNSRFSYLPAFAPASYPLPLPSPFLPTSTAPSTAVTPADPTPTSPTSGQTGVNTSTCLVWAGDALAYEVQLAQSSSFGSTSMVRSGGAVDTLYCTQGLPAATRLYWRVRAVAVAGVASAWSATRSFDTR